MFATKREVERWISDAIGSSLEEFGYKSKRGALPGYVSTFRENGFGAAVWYQLGTWENVYYLPRLTASAQPLALRVELGVAPVGAYMYNEAMEWYQGAALSTMITRQEADRWRLSAQSLVAEAWSEIVGDLDEGDRQMTASAIAVDSFFFPVATHGQFEVWRGLAEQVLLDAARKQLTMITRVMTRGKKMR
jgi:hypothetical protein